MKIATYKSLKQSISQIIVLEIWDSYVRRHVWFIYIHVYADEDCLWSMNQLFPVLKEEVYSEALEQPYIGREKMSECWADTISQVNIKKMEKKKLQFKIEIFDFVYFIIFVLFCIWNSFYVSINLL